MTTDLVKPKTCPRCKGAGYVASNVSYAGAPGGCFRCAGTGVVEADRATLKAQKEASEARVAASRFLFSGDLGFGDLTGADGATRRAAREFRNAVTWGWAALECHEPERLMKAATSILEGRVDVFAALAAYGKAHPPV